jgi:COMPASS component SWD3
MSVEMDVDSGDVVPQATELDAGPAPAEEDHAPETDVLMPESLPDAAPPDPIQPELSEPKPTPGPHYKIRYSLSGHTMSISSLKFSPDGSKLASSGLSYSTPLSSFIIVSSVKGRRGQNH